MPCLSDEDFILNDYAPNLVQLARSETAVPGQSHRIEPELAFTPIATNVHMHRLGAVETVEQEPVRPWNSGNPWHERSDPMISSSSTHTKSG
jgi:hypothetical protein